MSNYTTFKNSLKKLESRQEQSEKRRDCGVIYFDEYEKLIASGEIIANGSRSGKVGFLLVPRPALTGEQWEADYA